MKWGIWAATTRTRALGAVFILAALLALAVPTSTSTSAADAAPSIGNAPAVGTRLDAMSPTQTYQRRFWSVSLNKEMPYSIYLPKGYDSERQRYPVLYMLHGLGGNYREWEQSPLLKTATALIESGAIPPMIIVMPEGGRSYWVDHTQDASANYGRYVSDDLVSYLDDAYRTIPARRARAIGGLSMGAHGALDIALNNPGLFGVVGSHSLALRPMHDALSFFGTPKNWAAHDPVTLCRTSSKEIRNGDFALWLDIGKDDKWAPDNVAFHKELEAAGIPHTFNLWDGGHDRAYWSAHVEDYLRFYGDAFRTRPPRNHSVGAQSGTTDSTRTPAATRG